MNDYTNTSHEYTDEHRVPILEIWRRLHEEPQENQLETAEAESEENNSYSPLH